MKVTATKIKDIRDKEQLYIVIEEGEKKVIINCGIKTFTAVEELLKNEPITGKYTVGEPHQFSEETMKNKIKNKTEGGK